MTMQGCSVEGTVYRESSNGDHIPFCDFHIVFEIAVNSLGILYRPRNFLDKIVWLFTRCNPFDECHNKPLQIIEKMIHSYDEYNDDNHNNEYPLRPQPDDRLEIKVLGGKSHSYLFSCRGEELGFEEIEQYDDH